MKRVVWIVILGALGYFVYTLAIKPLSGELGEVRSLEKEFNRAADRYITSLRQAGEPGLTVIADPEFAERKVKDVRQQAAELLKSFQILRRWRGPARSRPGSRISARSTRSIDRGLLGRKLAFSKLLNRIGFGAMPENPSTQATGRCFNGEKPLPGRQGLYRGFLRSNQPSSAASFPGLRACPQSSPSELRCVKTGLTVRQRGNPILFRRGRSGGRGYRGQKTAVSDDGEGNGY